MHDPSNLQQGDPARVALVPDADQRLASGACEPGWLTGERGIEVSMVFASI
jgi:hypothetical protein